MKNIKLTIAYIGTGYSGWQSTQRGTSIEEALSEALQTILRHPVKLQAASRTDAGVHAQGQVVNFFSDTQIALSKIQHSLNQLLPSTIAVKQIVEASAAFHPTLDALSKEYRYEICNDNIQLPFYRETSWHFPYPLNLCLMQEASQHFIGSHDFSAFCNERSLWDRSPICTLDQIKVIELENKRLLIVIKGDHFLYKMVRNLVGTLVYIGCKKMVAEGIPLILSGKDRTLAGVTAPALGLRLQTVFYL